MSTKINISWPIDGSTLSECVALNQKIDEVASSAVVFSGTSRNSSPHVTIAMGMVEDTHQVVSKIAQLLKHMLRGLSKELIFFGAPHRDDQTGRYVVCDVSMPETWLQFRRAVRASCDRDIFVENARTSDKPHLTVAHVTSHFAEVDTLLQPLPRFSPCDVHTVDIALAGAKGARGDVLHSVKFDSYEK